LAWLEEWGMWHVDWQEGGKWKVEKEKRKMENGKLLDFATAKPILGIALKTMGLEKQPPKHQKHQKHQNHQEQKQ